MCAKLHKFIVEVLQEKEIEKNGEIEFVANFVPNINTAFFY